MTANKLATPETAEWCHYKRCRLFASLMQVNFGGMRQGRAGRELAGASCVEPDKPFESAAMNAPMKHQLKPQESNNGLIELRIYRYDPDTDRQPFMQTYHVEQHYGDKMVLDLLNRMACARTPE